MVKRISHIIAVITAAIILFAICNISISAFTEQSSSSEIISSDECSDQHHFEEEIIVNADTHTNGLKNMICTCCGYTIEEGIPSYHTVIQVDEVPAVCTETGYTEGLFCNECNIYISGHGELPALGHTEGEWETAREGNCTTTGTEVLHCIRDKKSLDYKEQITLPAFEDIDNSEFLPLITECASTWLNASASGDVIYSSLTLTEKDSMADRLNPMLYATRNGGAFTTTYRDILTAVNSGRTDSDGNGKSVNCITLCNMLIMGIPYEGSRLNNHENAIGMSGYAFDVCKLLETTSTDNAPAIYNPNLKLGINTFERILTISSFFETYEKLGLTKTVKAKKSSKTGQIWYSEIRPGDVLWTGTHTLMCLTVSVDGDIVTIGGVDATSANNISNFSFNVDKSGTVTGITKTIKKVARPIYAPVTSGRSYYEAEYPCDMKLTRESAINSENHSWGLGIITTAVTCISDGEITYYCEYNPEHTITSTITANPDAHVYTNNCDEVCDLCEADRTITHDYQPISCTEPMVCSVCGASNEEIAGHQYENNCDTDCNFCAEIRKITHDFATATCTTPETCTVCDVTNGDPLPHTYDNDCDTDCNMCEELREITHSFSAATCTLPETCTVCATKNGDPLGHSYDNDCDTNCNVCEEIREIIHNFSAATCILPETCIVCTAKNGEPLGHSYDNACDTSCNICEEIREITHTFSEATCTLPEICLVCATTNGTPLGHSYDNACDTSCNSCKEIREITHIFSEATCILPKTCTVCTSTDGEALGHSFDNNCDTSCDTCGVTRTITHNYGAATCTKAKTCTVCGSTSGKANGHKYTNACDKSCNVCKATRTIKHTYKTVTTKATLKKNGKVETKCSVCGYVSKTSTVYYPKTIKLSKTEYTYNGKAQTPSVTVKDSKGNTLKKDTDYTVKYASGRKNTGKYSVTITFKGKYSGTKTLSYNILPGKTSKITPTSYTTSIKVSWSKVTGASGYKVELFNSKGKVVKTITTTKTAYTFEKLSKVTTYKVRVTAYKTIDSKKVYAKSSTTITTATAPAKTTLSKVTAGKNLATPVWKSVTGASGYEVQYSTSSKLTNAKKTTVSKGSSTKTTIKKLSKGKTYYIKVRAFKTVDGKKIYGAWSAVKSVKVK